MRKVTIIGIQYIHLFASQHMEYKYEDTLNKCNYLACVPIVGCIPVMN